MPNDPYRQPRPRWAPKKYPNAELWYSGNTQFARYLDEDAGSEIVRIGDGSEGIFVTPRSDEAETFLDAAHAALRIPRCWHRPIEPVDLDEAA